MPPAGGRPDVDHAAAGGRSSCLLRGLALLQGLFTCCGCTRATAAPTIATRNTAPRAQPTVAILGGGPSGLAAAKAALEEGLLPTVFEQASSIGGVWRQADSQDHILEETPHGISAHGHTWHSMRTNLSKFTCCFSDFPWPADFSEDFPKAAEVAMYLERYADAFALRSRIRLRTRVVAVEMLPNSPAEAVVGGARVSWEEAAPVVSGGSGDEEILEGSEVFDFCVVATGVFARPFIPSEFRREYRAPPPAGPQGTGPSRAGVGVGRSVGGV